MGMGESRNKKPFLVICTSVTKEKVKDPDEAVEPFPLP